MDIRHNYFIKFSFRLVSIYLFLYLGTWAVIGVASPGGRFSSGFVSKYLDYPAIYRTTLLKASAGLLNIFGHESHVELPYKVRIKDQRGIKLVYSCLGIGMVSFWTAFIVSCRIGLSRKIVYLLAGLLLISFLNIGRIVLLVLSSNGYISADIGLEHHDFFNILCYVVVLLLIFLFDRLEKRVWRVNPISGEKN